MPMPCVPAMGIEENLRCPRGVHDAICRQRASLAIVVCPPPALDRALRDSFSGRTKQRRRRYCVVCEARIGLIEVAAVEGLMRGVVDPFCCIASACKLRKGFPRKAVNLLQFTCNRGLKLAMSAPPRTELEFWVNGRKVSPVPRHSDRPSCPACSLLARPSSVSNLSTKLRLNCPPSSTHPLTRSDLPVRRAALTLAGCGEGRQPRDHVASISLQHTRELSQHKHSSPPPPPPTRRTESEGLRGTV